MRQQGHLWRQQTTGRWPFRVVTHCTDQNSIRALHDHLERIHGITPWYLTGWYHSAHTWEQLLRRHQAAHDLDGWDQHSHADLPDVSWS
jgi:hypothetical protein